MASLIKTWTSGSGSLNITYTGSKDGDITITSSANDLTVSRSMTLTVSAVGAKVVTFKVTQAAKSGDFNIDFNNDFL